MSLGDAKPTSKTASVAEQDIFTVILPPVDDNGPVGLAATNKIPDGHLLSGDVE